MYTYWGRAANKDEKNPELLFVAARPNVNRKPSPDFIWGIEQKDTKEVTGICTEAMKRVVGFIFSETALDRLQGNADVRNIGSNKVLEKSGFKLEGTIRHGKMVSRYCDYNIWGLIRDDITENR